MKTLRAIWNDDSGQDLIEYALLAALVAVACAVVLTGIKNNLVTLFTSVNTQLTNAGG
jgi:pilus assembly protein Flp/PilA